MKTLLDPISVLKGVGPKKVEQLGSLGIETIEDLLLYFPFRYDDLQVRSLNELSDQEKVVLKGTVATPAVVNYFGPKKSRVIFQMLVDHVPVRVTFFNQTYIKNSIEQDQEVAVYGKWDSARRQLTGMKLIGKSQGENDLSPIYHVNKQVKTHQLQSLIRQAYTEYEKVIPEILPDEYVEKYHLMPRKQAIWTMHFPENMHRYEQARQRMAYEELFLFELKMQRLRESETKGYGQSHPYDVEKLRALIATLPFELTPAQKRVTNEICRDLMRPMSMNRLLQGDVGSGKTVIAALVMYAVTTKGGQAALLVPTEILAEQHYKSLLEVYQGKVKVALLTGSTSTKERRQILEELSTGSVDILVGTHAVIQKDVAFHNLQLGIVDEQHRFGVNQRKSLRQKGQAVDILSMTATPIPRTLAITAYGDMDLSVIDQMPSGRKPIQTKWVSHEEMPQLFQVTKDELDQGHQVYVICPLIAESEAIDAKNAETIYEEFKRALPTYRCGLLHGKMKATDKEVLMDEFVENKVQILVSTTVIEVGVNVPNASMMIIMDADRFGLAQLHQLRGRVGRGSTQSYCYLVANPSNEMGKERMKIMTETVDGFVLSQRDLEMRGPGEFFGAKQSGVPEFRVASLIDDQKILDAATADAKALQATDWEDKDEYSTLSYYLSSHHATHLD